MTTNKPTEPQLIIFDVDGTLCQRHEDKVNSYRAKWIANLKANGHTIAIATNQGGVGLRYWMEHDGFGDPAKYPTMADVDGRISKIARQIDCPNFKIAYRYQSKKGNWGPVPNDVENLRWWRRDYRKPQPGMLLDLMSELGFTAENTTYVGDRREDELAANGAGVYFEVADSYWGIDSAPVGHIALLVDQVPDVGMVTKHVYEDRPSEVVEAIYTLWPVKGGRKIYSQEELKKMFDEAGQPSLLQMMENETVVRSNLKWKWDYNFYEA